MGSSGRECRVNRVVCIHSLGPFKGRGGINVLSCTCFLLSPLRAASFCLQIADPWLVHTRRYPLTVVLGCAAKVVVCGSTLGTI